MNRERVLGPIGVAAMEKRALNPETAARLGVFTASSEGGEVIADASGNILVFPMQEHGIEVGQKYRGPNKKFWQKTGSKQVFINSAALDDPSLWLPAEDPNSNPLVIVEGEPDMISAIDVGYPLTVSVPAGAPARPKEKRPDPEPADDASGKFEFMWSCRDQLKKIRRFIIAVDHDAPGHYLAEELVRRLGAARCAFVIYPDGCKDLNDVLMRHGPEAARRVLDQARPYPLKGIYALADYPDRPPITTYTTGWPILDTLFKPFAPSFTVVTGLPGSGKSTFITNLCINLASLHGWKAAIFSPEMPVAPHLRDKMRRIVSGESVERLTGVQLAAGDRFLNEHFVFIDYDVAGEDDHDLTLEWLLDRAHDALMRYGIRVLIIDPWNEIEHAKVRHESMTEYINRGLRQLIKFGRRHGLATFVLAHPTKEVGKDGKARVPTLYDIDGSAAFFNKPDFGIVVDRPNQHVDKTHIHVRKVRFEGTGNKGEVVLQFNRENSRFEMIDPNARHYGQQELM